MPEHQRSTTIHGALLRWMFRPLRWVSLGMASLGAAYVMTTEALLEFDMLSWVPFFILAHCLALVWIAGRVERSSFGYLYVQGHDRDTLWRHTMIATTLSVFCVWIPSSMLIWLGLRSGYQEWSGNFNFPLMSPLENSFPLWCLLAYGVLIPTFHYAWIRGVQATRGSASGFVIGAATVLVAFGIWNGVRVPDMPTWTIVAMASGFIVAAFTLLVAGRKLHRRIEVIS